MKALINLLSLNFLFTFIFSNNNDKKQGNVLILEDKNFDSVLLDNTKILVAFYADWCRHCHHLLPEFKKASEILKELDSKIRLGIVNCPKNTYICGEKRYNITNYPTIKYFVAETPHAYNGNRAANDLVMWLLKYGLEKNARLSDHEEVLSHIQIVPITTIYFGVNTTLEFEAFAANTRQNLDSGFGYCDSQECLSYFNVSDGQMIVFNSLTPNEEEKRVTIPKEAVFENENDVVRLIDIFSSPFVMDFGYKTSKIAYIHKVNMIYFLCADDNKRRDDFRKALYEAAKPYRGIFQFVISDLRQDQEHQVRLGRMLGIKRYEMPILVLHDKTEAKYRLSNVNFRNSSNILNFIEGWQNKTISRYYKTEDPYPNQENALIKNLTAGEFQLFLNTHHSKGREVVVCYYAEYSHESMKFLELYPEIAKLFAGMDIVFAQMNYRANEIEGLKIQFFPVINLYYVNKEIKEFKGDPTKTESFVNFLDIYSNAGKARTKAGKELDL